MYKAVLTLCTLFFFLKPFKIIGYLSDCTNMMIMSHCGISVVINVSQEELKMGTREKNWFSACGTKMLAIMKSIRTAVIPAYLRTIVYAALHTRMKTAAQPAFI